MAQLSSLALLPFFLGLRWADPASQMGELCARENILTAAAGTKAGLSAHRLLFLPTLPGAPLCRFLMQRVQLSIKPAPGAADSV